MARFNLADHIQAAQPPQVRDIEAITTEILDAKQRAGEAILTIGRGLMEAKALLSHGEWLPWLEERVEFSEASAQRYMMLAREYSNPATLRDLGYSKALVLLALPEKSRDEFIEVPHVVNGEEKTVTDMSVRELKAAIKERDEALKAAEQAKAEQTAAEQARELQNTLDQVNAELEALKSRPVEVAVETDPTAVEAARKETEERMKAKLDEAKRAQAEAEEGKKAAEDAKAEAQMEVTKANSMLEEARRQAEDARQQAEEARKKAAVISDADLVLFSELLDQAQTLVKRMGGVRLKKKAKDPETAGKLQAAMMALASAVKESACQ